MMVVCGLQKVTVDEQTQYSWGGDISLGRGLGRRDVPAWAPGRAGQKGERQQMMNERRFVTLSLGV